jgi:hypothetical protein
MTQHPDGNFTKYLKTKSEECADNNRTILTIAHDGSVSFIKMKPMYNLQATKGERTCTLEH